MCASQSLPTETRDPTQEGISDNTANPRGFVSGKVEQHTSTLVKKAPDIGGFAANIACGFFEFGGVVLDVLVKFPKVFAVL